MGQLRTIGIVENDMEKPEQSGMSKKTLKYLKRNTFFIPSLQSKISSNLFWDNQNLQFGTLVGQLKERLQRLSSYWVWVQLIFEVSVNNLIEYYAFAEIFFFGNKINSFTLSFGLKIIMNVWLKW